MRAAPTAASQPSGGAAVASATLVYSGNCHYDAALPDENDKDLQAAIAEKEPSAKAAADDGDSDDSDDSDDDSGVSDE